MLNNKNKLFTKNFNFILCISNLLKKSIQNLQLFFTI